MFDKSFTPDQREEVGIQLMCQFEDTMQRFLEIMESRLTAPKSYDDEEFIQRCITMGMDEVKGVCWYLVELGIINRSDYDRHMYYL